MFFELKKPNLSEIKKESIMEILFEGKENKLIDFIKKVNETLTRR